MGEYERALRMMRRHDPQRAEDGFQRLRTIAARHVDELIGEYAAETDHGLRCWLLELIGEARSPRAYPLLVAELRSDDEAFRYWAQRGLEQLDTRQARRELWQHRRNESGPPESRGGPRRR